MTKDSGLQVAPSRRPTRERVGLIVDGANAAAATKTIAGSRSCRSTANLDGIITFLARYINDICSGSNKNIYNTLRNVHCANLSTSSAGPGKAGRGFKRYCTWSTAPWNRPQSPHDYRGHVWLATNNSVSPFARICGSAACRHCGKGMSIITDTSLTL